jgi:hypothetical protein
MRRVLRTLRKQLTYANVMATIAVFLALGGGAYAITLKRNSVKSKTIAPDAAKGVDVDEASLAIVPNAANAASAANAATLDGLDSTGFATAGQVGAIQTQLGTVQTQLNSVSGKILTGTVNPTVISATFFTVPSMNLRVETDAVNTGVNNIVVNDLDSTNDLALFTQGGPGAIINEQTINAPGDFAGSAAGPSSDSQLDGLISSSTTNERLMIHCLFADNRDYCYGIVGP